MSDKNALFKPMDEGLFKGVDSFKTSGFYSQTSDEINNLGETPAKIINRLIALAAVFLPILVVAGLAGYALILNKEVKQRKAVLALVSKVKRQKSEWAQLSRSIMSPHQVNNQSDLNTRINNVKRRLSPRVRLSLSGFEMFSAQDLQMSNAQLKFSGATTIDLSTLLKALVQNEKLKVTKLSIKRKSTSLEGTIGITHYGRKAQ